jgi:regulator-associated protein of mTOR
MVTATQPDPNNNEDARSTSSTLVNGGENNARNDVDVPERNATSEDITTITINNTGNQIRHGFDQELYEEDIIRFLYFSEKSHDTNAKPNAVVRNALKDWVRKRKKTKALFYVFTDATCLF